MVRIILLGSYCWFDASCPKLQSNLNATRVVALAAHQQMRLFTVEAYE
jgi:hypothetical protein